MVEQYYTPPKLAELLGKSLPTIYRWIDKGWIETTKTFNGHYRITKAEAGRLLLELNRDIQDGSDG